MQAAEFRKIVYTYYKKHGRKLPWRLNPRSSTSRVSVFYKILVSEIMLQQTQVDRVIPKYEAFLKKFPTMRSLARAERVEVLRAWQGLGYNRRALWLHDICKSLSNAKSLLPKTPDSLSAFKGIGPNTAASICAFAYDMPVVFIETNIRTVFLKHFFAYEKNVRDEDILKLVEKTLPKKGFREWYWALMDYGSYLKRTQGNANRAQSAHYARQATFKGSVRQLRGAMLREVLYAKKISWKEFEKKFSQDERFERAFAGLVKDGCIRKKKGSIVCV